MSRPPRPTSSSPLDCSGGVFDWDVALRKLDELNARVEDPTLWDRPSEAQSVSRERAALAAKVEAVQGIERDLKDALEYAECYGASETQGEWKREIAIYDRDLDRTVAYRCPDCGHEWNRS